MDKTVPAGAALSRADKYHVYRPMLDLIGRFEGTDKGEGTLGYGIMLDGKVTKGKGTSVKLVGMTRCAPVEDAQRPGQQAAQFIGHWTLPNHPHDDARSASSSG